MLIENLMVEEVLSGEYIPCIPEIIALNSSLSAETRAGPLRPNK